jgi:hypothetical protein
MKFCPCVFSSILSYESSFMASLEIANRKFNVLHPIILLRLTLFFFLMVSCSGLNKKPYIYISPDYSEVHFERAMSKAQLEKLKYELAKVNINIEFVDFKYDGDLLNYLSFVIDYRGEQGVGSTHFVHKGRPFGFIIDARPTKEYRFIIGELPNSEK